MTKEKKAVALFSVVSAVSFITAFIPVLKGERMNVTFLGAGVVFLVIAIVNAKKIPPPGGNPPTV